MSFFPNLFHRIKQSFLIIYVLSCSCPLRTKSSALSRQIFASFYRNNLSIFYIDIHWAAGRTDTTDCFFYLFLSMFFLTQYRSSLFLSFSTYLNLSKKATVLFIEITENPRTVNSRYSDFLFCFFRCLHCKRFINQISFIHWFFD